MRLNRVMAGRPRDTSIDERVLAATRELLVEVGWDDLSVRLVAARCGVGRSSLSRRWASKAELVLHAILGESPDMSPFSGTDLAGWIEWVVRGSHQLFVRPDVSEAVPGLLLALRENPSCARRCGRVQWPGRRDVRGQGIRLRIGRESCAVHGGWCGNVRHHGGRR